MFGLVGFVVAPMTSPKNAKASASFFFGWIQPRISLARAVQKHLFMRVMLLASPGETESLILSLTIILGIQSHPDCRVTSLA